MHPKKSLDEALIFNTGRIIYSRFSSAFNFIAYIASLLLQESAIFSERQVYLFPEFFTQRKSYLSK
ncbi:hypothetical protein ACFP3I_10835 [Chryseobacterium arachidis]|uniref:hypothetical protein n=1 Tax=Chryseobacterium arachidis TaxID=1416778 RepID=UPI00361C4255